MKPSPQINLSAVALLLVLIFVMSAVGCSPAKDEGSKFKISEPHIVAEVRSQASNDSEDADDSQPAMDVIPFRHFAANPREVTSRDAIVFAGRSADKLSAKTVCTVHSTEGHVRTIGPQTWIRPFKQEVRFLEILPTELALQAFDEGTKAVCSFDFAAIGSGEHRFRLLNIPVNPIVYKEDIVWGEPAMDTRRFFSGYTEEERAQSLKGVPRVAIDVACENGSHRIFVPEHAEILDGVVKAHMEDASLKGEINWLETVQKCALGRVEDGVVKARSKGFVLSFAPSIVATFRARDDEAFDADSSFPLAPSGLVGFLNLKNMSNVPARVRIPNKIVDGMQHRAVLEKRRGGEVKYYCDYKANIALSPISIEAKGAGGFIEVKLDAYESVQLGINQENLVRYGNKAGPELLVTMNDQVNPMIQIFEGLDAVENEKPVGYATFTSGAPVMIRKAGSNLQRIEFTASSQSKGECNFREHLR